MLGNFLAHVGNVAMEVMGLLGKGMPGKLRMSPMEAVSKLRAGVEVTGVLGVCALRAFPTLLALVCCEFESVSQSVSVVVFG